MPETKTSKISKTISRKVQTAKFENLEIRVSSEEEITWSTPQERLKKTESHAKLLCKEFLITMEKSLQELGLETQPASASKSNFDSL